MRISNWFLGMLLLFLGQSLFAQSGDILFSREIVHELRIEFDDLSFWDTLSINYLDNIDFSGSDIPYSIANLTIDGAVLDSVGVRFKGKSSYYYGNGIKNSFKVDLNEFVSGQKFDGLKKFNLHNGMGDPGFVRDLLSYGMMREVGVHAPRIAFARLYLNGEYWGLYEIVEQIDKTFLKNNFSNANGNLYKNQRWSNLEWLGADPEIYKETFELKTNEEEDNWSDLIHFLDVLNNSSDEDFPEAIQEVFNVDLFLRVLAIDIMTNNWDSYIDNIRNYYLYHHPGTGKFNWIPWDYNLAMGGDLSIEGNPFRPVDPFCLVNADFDYAIDGDEVSFYEVSAPVADEWQWKFGDGSSSTISNPQHTYESMGIKNVCLTVYVDSISGTCEQTRCKKIDLSKSPSLCETVINGTCPHAANDPILQRVMDDDSFCCENTWDAFCELKYQEYADDENRFNFAVDYDIDFPLILGDTSKVLISRLLSVPEFLDKYLEISCVIRDNIFTANNIFPKINDNAGLIRTAIYQDPNYLYTWDYFEYDVGNGSGGGGKATIPAIKYFFNQRIPQVQADLDETGYNCNDIGSPIQPHDVVINEFVATSSEDGGVADAAGEFDDWIELYNTTTAVIDLSGFYLTDDFQQSYKWAFPPGTLIAPQDYLIVWADKDEMQSGLHASFKLSKSGEELMLHYEDGTVIDSLFFGEQVTNMAMARVPNGTGNFVRQIATFDENNNVVDVDDENEFHYPMITCYPNPTTQFVNVSINQKIESKYFKIRLNDVFGNTVMQREYAHTNGAMLDLSNMSSGVYFINININGKNMVKKLFIE